MVPHKPPHTHLIYSVDPQSITRLLVSKHRERERYLCAIRESSTIHTILVATSSVYTLRCAHRWGDLLVSSFGTSLNKHRDGNKFKLIRKIAWLKFDTNISLQALVSADRRESQFGLGREFGAFLSCVLGYKSHVPESYGNLISVHCWSILESYSNMFLNNHERTQFYAPFMIPQQVNTRLVLIDWWKTISLPWFWHFSLCPFICEFDQATQSIDAISDLAALRPYQNLFTKSSDSSFLRWRRLDTACKRQRV